MKIAPLVEHLAGLDVFSGRVVAATDIESAVAKALPLPSPSCVLFGITEQAAANDIAGQGGPRHRVAVGIQLLIVVRNAAANGSAFDELDTVRETTVNGLLGWVPTDQAYEGWEPLEYAQGQFAYADAGTVIWKDTFTTRYTMSKQ